MRASVIHGTRDVRVEDVPDATIREPTDALVRVTHACICGSDLWPYRGELMIYGIGGRTGHEFIGIVEDVGPDVHLIKKGDRVIAPFAFSDGTCAYCERNLHTSCVAGGYWGGQNDGGQGEAVRAPLADGTLVPIPSEVDLTDPHLVASFAALTDVMATGHHAAVSAGVGPGCTAAVVGDGAVGLCAVLASARLGAERVIALGHHAERLLLAQEFGATDVVAERGDEAVARVREITNGGVPKALECVGTDASFDAAIHICRPGGVVGHVGVPVGGTIDLLDIHMRNIRLIGGVAPARAYIPELLSDVLIDRLDPSRVFDLTVDIDGIPAGYAAMDERRAIKVLIATGAA
jgi:threonine dehydrogenase-like Zn-dependent dehydrogenase